MYKEHKAIEVQFEKLIDAWQNRNIRVLPDIVADEVEGHISTVFDPSSEANGLYMIEQFVKSTPAHDRADYQIGNELIRQSGDAGFSTAEVAVKAYDSAGAYFMYIAEFACKWEKRNDIWMITDIRIDIEDFDSPLRDVYAESWYFGERLAVLKPGVHYQCILPEIDNPYYQIPAEQPAKTDEEEIRECFARYNFGKDNLMYVWVKDTLSDRFENDDKKHFIAYNKFITQRYRYNFSSWKAEQITVGDNEAEGVFVSIVPDTRSKHVRFVRENGHWHILNIEGGR